MPPQIVLSKGFRYPYDISPTLEPWRDKLGEDFERVVAILTDRDRALEDYTATDAPVFDQVIVEESTTSTTPVSLGGPTVTVKLPRGKCIITSCAYVTSTVTGQTAYAELWMDGAFLQSAVLLGNNTGGGISASLSSTVAFEDLAPGQHTFTLLYAQTLGGATARFDARTLTVDPVL